MRLFTARRLALAALVPALLLVCVIPGCSNEGEGERCGTTQADDSDCADGLVCTGNLLDAPNTFRCCYPNGAVTDSRCQTATGVATGGTGGASTGGTGGASTGGTGGASTGGTGGDTADAGDVTAAGAGGN
jgi:hypothetical protein